MMKLRYTIFALLDHYSWTVGGCQNLEIHWAPFVIRPPQQFRGEVETPVRAMVHLSDQEAYLSLIRVLEISISVPEISISVLEISIRVLEIPIRV